MPASQINKLFKEGRLHSGSPDGPIVKDPHQALAIRLSYLRKEGQIPEQKKKKYQMTETFHRDGNS